MDSKIEEIKEPEVVKKNAISDEDKEKFFKSVMSDTIYEEEIPLFGGKAKLTFGTFTVEENNDILEQVNIDREKGIAGNTEAYFVTLASYRLGVALKAVDGVPWLAGTTKDKFKQAEDKNTYIYHKAAKFKTWQHMKLRLYLDAHGMFEKKINELSREVFTEGFWKAAA